MIQVGIVEILVFIALGLGALGGSRLAFWLIERYVVFGGHHHNPGEEASDKAAQ
jgi:hypothetical protein